MSRIRFFIFCFLGLISASSSAQKGCLSSTGNLYISLSGTHNGVNQYDWNGSGNDPNRISNAAGVYCLRSFSPAKNCYVRYNCGFFGCTYALGEEVTYGPLPCPLDDYMPLLILAAGGFGFFFLKRNNLLGFS